jgi:hypothetical protein
MTTARFVGKLPSAPSSAAARNAHHPGESLPEGNPVQYGPGDRG